jgi:hypothetical protein
MGSSIVYPLMRTAEDLYSEGPVRRGELPEDEWLKRLPPDVREQYLQSRYRSMHPVLGGIGSAVAGAAEPLARFGGELLYGLGFGERPIVPPAQPKSELKGGPAAPPPAPKTQEKQEQPPASPAPPSYAYEFPKPVQGPVGELAPKPAIRIGMPSFTTAKGGGLQPVPFYYTEEPPKGSLTSDQVLEQAVAAVQNRDSAKADQLMAQLSPGHQRVYAERLASPTLQRSIQERDLQQQKAEGERAYVARQGQDIEAGKQRALGFAGSYQEALATLAKGLYDQEIMQLQSAPDREKRGLPPTITDAEKKAAAKKAEFQAVFLLQQLVVGGPRALAPLRTEGIVE